MTGCQSLACQGGGSSGLGSPCLCFCEQRVNPKTGEVSDTPVGMMDVYQEFNELSEKFKIMKYKSKVRMANRRGVAFRDTSVPADVPFPVFRKWRRTTHSRFQTFPVAASIWKSDIL